MKRYYQLITEHRDAVHEFLEEEIELPAANSLSVNYSATSIYNIIENIDDYREAINNFTEDKLKDLV